MLLGSILTLGIVKSSFRNAFELGFEVPDQRLFFPQSLLWFPQQESISLSSKFLLQSTYPIIPYCVYYSIPYLPVNCRESIISPLYHKLIKARKHVSHTLGIWEVFLNWIISRPTMETVCWNGYHYPSPIIYFSNGIEVVTSSCLILHVITDTREEVRRGYPNHLFTCLVHVIECSFTLVVPFWVSVTCSPSYRIGRISTRIIIWTWIQREARAVCFCSCLLWTIW